jgi:hypothetical protein
MMTEGAAQGAERSSAQARAQGHLLGRHASGGVHGVGAEVLLRALYLVELVLQAHELQVQPPPFWCNLPWRWKAEQLARALFGAARPAVGVAWQEGNSAIAVRQDGWMGIPGG